MLLRDFGLIPKWLSTTFLPNSYCIACKEKIPNLGFCSLCFENKLSLQSLRLYGLFLYKHEVRDLVLAAKVHNDLLALETILDLVLNHPLILELLKNCDALAMAPSSVYSRFLGKTDLSYLMSYNLSQKFKIPLCYPSFKSYWRVKKQSQKIRQKGQFWDTLSNFPSKANGLKRLLIIDDVLTSGYTLLELGEYFASDYEVFFLTFAYA